MVKEIVTELKELNREPRPAFMTFSKPFDQETAVMQFNARYGYPPAEINKYKNLLMLGPVSEKGFYLVEGDE